MSANSISSSKKNGPVKWIDYNQSTGEISIKPATNKGAEILRQALKEVAIGPGEAWDEGVETEWGLPTGGPPTFTARHERPLGVVFNLLTKNLIDAEDYQNFSKAFSGEAAITRR